MNIRKLAKEDFDGVKALAEEFFALAAQGTKYTWNDSGFANLFNLATDDNSSFTGIVAEDGGVVIGVLVFAVLPTMAYHQVVGHEMMWYVRPDARGSVGVRMFKMAEDVAKCMGANAMVFVANKASGFDKVCDFYRRQGYKEIEHLYQKDF
jgi:GNAT superfamily N-acetyltransferase